MIWDNFTFLYPFAFLIVLFYLLCRKFCKVKQQTIPFSNLVLLKAITSKENKIKEFLELLFIVCISFAIANPVIEQTSQKIDKNGYEIAISLDASMSMQDDNRFEISKEIIQEFIKNRKNDRLALSLFAEHVYLAVPFTYNKKPLEKVLEFSKLGVAGSVGTSLYDALYLNGNLFKNSKSTNKIAILLTDGIDTKNNIALDIAIENLKKYEIKTYIIAVGNEDEFHKDILEKIANETGGKFFHSKNPKELSGIYKTIDGLEKSKIESDSYTSYEYLYIYPLFVALVCLLVLIYTKKEKKVYLYFVFVFLVLSFFKPILELNNDTTNKRGKFIIALDISKSMLASDMKPSRYEFAKNKIESLLDKLQNEEVAILAFSNETYLISPFTNNYSHLKTFMKNLYLDGVLQNGTEYLKLLKHGNNFFESPDKKAILVFTDGGESDTFTKEIEYAKDNEISTFVYLLGTQNESAIKIDGTLLRDGNNQIVLTKQNLAIKNLSDETKGEVYLASHLHNDMDSFVDTINKSFTSKHIDAKNQFPLFIVWLFIALGLFFLWRFEVRR
jgi:Ca-activated chloride channel family protein